MGITVRTVSGRGLSPVGLGCSRIGSFNNTASLKDMRELLARSLDLGITVFDTADIYGQGDSERELGKAIALSGRRDDTFVMTKVGKSFSARMRLLRPFKPIIKPLLAATGLGGGAVTARRGANLGGDFDPARLERAVDSSLRRLGVETVDGLLLHSPPAAVVRDPAVRQLLASLCRSGKVRHYGVSCDDIDALEAAASIEGLSLLQLPLDLLDDPVGSGVAARLADRGVAIFVREVIRLSPGLVPSAAVAKACRRPEVTSAIVGTSRLDHLREIVAAGAS